MHKAVHLSGRIVDAAEASINPLSKAALFGKGVFTTIAIHDRVPFLWDLHWSRLDSHASRLQIDISAYSESSTKQALEELINHCGFDSGRARITFFDGSASEQWPYDSSRTAGLLMTLSEFNPVPQNFRLGISPFPVNSGSPLAGIKSCNYLEPIFVLESAKSQGFDECVRLNQRGEVTSAALANLFWLRNGRLFTPSASTGCLGGTTREYVMGNFECEDVSVGLDDLRTADEIFLTSAGLGVAQVAEIEGQVLNQRHHPILDLLPIRL